jgi:hypothetical protein
MGPMNKQINKKPHKRAREMIFAMQVMNKGLESGINESFPQINKKWKNNSLTDGLWFPRP